MKPNKQRMSSYLKFISLLSFMAITCGPVTVQAEDFYDINTVNTLHITFTESNWDQLLDDLYAAGEEERLTGTAVINGVTYDSVGVRYKGNSSYQSAQVKNPLNIKLDYLVDDQTLGDYGTLKLANVYKDPSFIREVLGYEIARKYMPASKANFIDVYINESHIGLYTSVQDVDKYFLSTHFGSKDNASFKGEVDDIFQSGDIWGYIDAEETSYYDYYELDSGESWDDLIDFLYIFNESPSLMEDVLNVDSTLWMLAFDILTVNLDSPVNVGHNYYIYKDGTERFNPVLWDLNESFGAFTTLIGGRPLSTQNMQQLSPFLNATSTNYPIINNILTDPSYKKMFVAHMKTIIDENFAEGQYEVRASEIQEWIATYVQDDPNKFYTDNDFINNIETSIVSGPESIVGITELMDSRIIYLESQSEFAASPPTISDIVPPTDATSNSTLWFTATVDDATLVQLAYRQNGIFVKEEMFDDGNHQDGSAADGVYGVSVDIGMGDLDYYIYGENDDAASFSPVRAEYEFYSLSVESVAGDLVINEFMADNGTTARDQDEEYDDWIELYNNSNSEISLEGYYLSDDSTEVTQWTFPAVSIAANGYVIIWADNDEDQEGLHANFKLSASGETIVLSSPDETILDEVVFEEQTEDISTGRDPNGTGDFTAMNPSFSTENSLIQNVPGDVDGNSLVELTDAILVLQVMTGMTPSSTVYNNADINDDGNLGLQEVIYILESQK